jgi:hypothetical protein
MGLKFRGNYARLKKYASLVDPDGQWRALEYGGKQYRTNNGAVLNWWERSGKMLFQGHGPAARAFEQSFKAIASAKKRLISEDDAHRLKLSEQNTTLLTSFVDVLLENERLRKHQSRR